MNKRRATYTLLLILCSVLVSLPEINIATAEPNKMWLQAYGGTEDDGALSLVQTSDGGYALVGYTRSYGAGDNDFWLVKLDGSGNMEWNRTYGGAGSDIASSLIETSDGGYAIAGYTESFDVGSDDFLVVKTDASGNMEWNQTYGGTKGDYAFSLVEASDGGYAIAGYTRSYGAGRDDYWLIKTDGTGNMEWSHTYGGWDDDGAISLIQTSDGGYAIVGMTESFGPGGDDFWLIKTDASGNMQWNKTYGGPNGDYGFSLVETSDGGYAIAGSTYSFGAGDFDSWFVKTDGSGNMEWNQTYGGEGNDGASSLVQTSDGGYALAGSTRSYGAGNFDFWLVKTDGDGDMEWNQRYGGIGVDIASSLIETSNSGYVIAGYTYSGGAGNSDLWLIKTDENGIIPEFPSWIILPLFLVVTLFAIIIRTKKFCVNCYPEHKKLEQTTAKSLG